MVLELFKLLHFLPKFSTSFFWWASVIAYITNHTTDEPLCYFYRNISNSYTLQQFSISARKIF